MHLLHRRQAENTDVVFGASYTRSPSVRGVRLLAIGSALIILTAGTSALALARTAAISPDNAGPTTATKKTIETTVASEAQPQPAIPVSAPKTASARVAAPTPSCRKGSYSLPSTIEPAAKAPGLYMQVDPASNYTVYGTSSSAIWAQIYACTPVVSGGRFAANTGYNLSSYYTYGPSGTMCSVTSAVVTLHVNQIYPNWVNTGASSATASAWNSFISDLQTHENGHVALDKQYAQQLYDQLTGAQNVGCGSINATIQSITTANSNAIAAANANYDNQTNHGATQGAVL